MIESISAVQSQNISRWVTIKIPHRCQLGEIIISELLMIYWDHITTTCAQTQIQANFIYPWVIDVQNKWISRIIQNTHSKNHSLTHSCASSFIRYACTHTICAWSIYTSWCVAYKCKMSGNSMEMVKHERYGMKPCAREDKLRAGLHVLLAWNQGYLKTGTWNAISHPLSPEHRFRKWRTRKYNRKSHDLVICGVIY